MITEQRRLACLCDICQVATSEFYTADEQEPFKAADAARAVAVADGWRERRFPLAAVLVQRDVPPTLAAAVARCFDFARDAWIVCPQCVQEFDAWLEAVPSDGQVKRDGAQA